MQHTFSKPRRAILTAALVVGAAVTSVFAHPAPDLSLAAVERAERPMKILILGGTGFIGPHMVEFARARGHEVTLFNRGRTNADMFPDIEQLHGDRDDTKGEGLNALRDADSHWDAVIDNSGYVLRHVRDSAGVLKGKADRYLFISSVSVYSDFSVKGLSEDDPVGTLEDTSVEEITFETYGPLKAYCEQAVRDEFGDGATVVRPGLIVGPGDSTDRFTYWPVRMSMGGEVLAPGNPEDPVQFIDVRDLARFVVTLLENGTPGTYNACGPGHTVSMAELVYASRAAAGVDTTVTWVPSEFLLERGVQPWGQMPLFAPGDGEFAGINCASNARAIGAGLVFHTPAQTIADTLAWFPGDRDSDALRAGWSLEDEAGMLAQWKAHLAGEDDGHEGHDHGDHGDHDGHDH